MDSQTWRFYSLAFTLLFCGSSIVNAATASQQCEEVKTAYVNMGFSPLDVPMSSVALRADDLEICPAGFSCCTRDMETQLSFHSRQKYDDRLVDATDSAKRHLVTATTELHSFFTSQLKKTEKELDEMFTTAYDKRYTDNKDVFTQFFAGLKRYYSGDDLDVGRIVEQFFRDVFVRMFTLQNSDYNFTEPYLGCVGDKMETIKPFGEYPAQLQRNLKQALMAARTYVQGLVVGRNVVMTTQRIQPTASCTKANMKMNFCSHCHGLPSLKPCASYCLNVMKGCLAYNSELNRPWQDYVAAMDALSMRLKSDGSFNLESVLSPLKDQVSLAIMQSTVQNEAILHKVLDSSAGCGQPQESHRSKRAAPSLENVIPYRTKSTVDLKRLVDGVKVVFRELQHLWSHNSLAGTMCSQISATTGKTCWNGESDTPYTKGLVGNGLAANRENPEVKVDPSRPDPEIMKQIQQLNNVTAMIINATVGANKVVWVNLQIPLPNVSAAVEGRAVKSDKTPFGFLSDLGSGSGFSPMATDDEDGFSGWKGLPLLPDDGSGASGGGSLPLVRKPVVTVKPEEPFTLVAEPNKPPEQQPEKRPGVSQVYAEDTTVKTNKITDSAPPSSSNRLRSVTELLSFSLLVTFSISYWQIL